MLEKIVLSRVARGDFDKEEIVIFFWTTRGEVRFFTGGSRRRLWRCGRGRGKVFHPRSCCGEGGLKDVEVFNGWCGYG